MLRFLPTGWMGLMLGGLVAANSSTILTHLNWGASYLVHDFYRRFLNRARPRHHYVMAGRYATVLLFVASSAHGLRARYGAGQPSICMLQVGAGTGLLYLVRWFWWRVTAWCEIVAMVVSFLVSAVFLYMARHGTAPGSAQQLMIGIAMTTVCWLITAYVGPQTDQRVLIEFYRKVRPIRAGLGADPCEGRGDCRRTAAETDNFPLALLGWFTGCIMIWSALFTVGNFLYGRMGYAYGLLAVFVVSAAILIQVVRRLWR